LNKKELEEVEDYLEVIGSVIEEEFDKVFHRVFKEIGKPGRALEFF